jgi:hypothetical protein
MKDVRKGVNTEYPSRPQGERCGFVSKGRALLGIGFGQRRADLFDHPRGPHSPESLGIINESVQIHVLLSWGAVQGMAELTNLNPAAHARGLPVNREFVAYLKGV